MNKKKRGLSLEDKRQIILNLFREDHSFFHYKEIEKYATVHKVSFMQVKELLEGLVADNLIETDKVGSSNFYWSLPTRVLAAKKKQIKLLKEQREAIKTENENMEKKIEQNKALRKETKERTRNLEALTEKTKRIEECKKVVEKFKKNDPERYEKLKQDSKAMIELYEHWSDNICTIEQWLRSKMPEAKMTELFPECKDLPLFNE